ncbi:MULTISPECIES: AraC family transcriptional regulator [Faecalicatena]|nr:MULTISPECIES: AraC family transcriptional regulator [Faecalicatena]MCI6467787.1 AraC family transcriptional regulator [Faecalicatena sp.]
MSQCAPHEFWGPRSRPDYHMHFVLSGSGCLEIEEKKYIINAGQIFLLPPDKIVYYYANSKTPWCYAWATFQGKKAAYYLKKAGFPPDVLIRSCNIHPGDFAAVIHKMLLANSSSYHDGLLRTSYLYELFSLLVSSSKLSLKYKPTLKQQIEYAVQYMEYNYNSDIQISDITNYLGLSRSYFSREFHKQMNCSPKEYLMNYRINEAKKLLQNTELSINDIAQKIGYKDTFSFSRIFHDKTSLSPTLFRSLYQTAKNS